MQNLSVWKSIKKEMKGGQMTRSMKYRGQLEKRQERRAGKRNLGCRRDCGFYYKKEEERV